MDAIVLRMVILLSMLILVLARYQVTDDTVYPENEAYNRVFSNDGEASSSSLVNSNTIPGDEVFDRVLSNDGEASSSLLAKSKTNLEDEASDRVFSYKGGLSSSSQVNFDTKYKKEVVLPNSMFGVAAKCTSKCSFYCMSHIFHYKKCYDKCFVCCEIANMRPRPPPIAYCSG